LFVSICEHLNAEYFLRAWTRNDKCCVILRVPILKRSFGAFKPTKNLAKELVAEMAIEEFIKKQPNSVYAIAKSWQIKNNIINTSANIVEDLSTTTAFTKITTSPILLTYFPVSTVTADIGSIKNAIEQEQDSNKDNSN